MDVVIGIAMTSHDARLLLVEGTHGDGSVIDHDSLDPDNRVSVEHSDFREHIVNAVIDTRAAAPANRVHRRPHRLDLDRRGGRRGRTAPGRSQGAGHHQRRGGLQR